MGFKNFIFKWSVRLLQPKAAKRMEEDGALTMPAIDGPMENDTDYILIDDRGADLTVFAYSGLDALFAGRARYEFRMLFRKLGVKCNLVCFRDLRRTCFYVAHDGTPHGLEFYTEKTKEIMEKLGSKYNVALGSSSGGEAAFVFATRCKMDKVIAFAPVFPHSVYRAPMNILRALLNFKVLFTEPEAYIEIFIVTMAIMWMEDVALKRVRRKNPKLIWDTWKIYEEAGDERPEATVFYGERSGPDSRQARQAAAYFPQVKLMPVDTARHNSPAVLMKRKQLSEMLTAELQFASGEDEAGTDCMAAADRNQEP